MALDGRAIAVIGGGIGGLAAATALAQRRARVVLWEASPHLGEVGAGIQVAPNGVAVLEALGLYGAAERLASLPEAVVLRDWRGGTVARTPLGRAAVARYGRPYWQFHRADLLGVLVDGAREAGVEIRLGTRVTDIVASNGSLRIAPEAAPAFDADLVVAADGVRSSVRQRWFAGVAPRFTGHVAWRGLVDMRALPPELGAAVATVTMGPGRHLVTYPLREGSLLNFVAVEERADWIAEGWSQPDDPDRLRAAFTGWLGGPGAVLAAVDRTFLWGLFDHPRLPAWVRGRIALLGDACHPMLPYLAQGATMALEDAWVLAAELAVAPSPEAGLRAYEARRAPRARRVQAASARNGRLFHLRRGFRDLAQTGLAVASRVAPAGLLRRLDWLYGTDETRLGG